MCVPISTDAGLARCILGQAAMTRLSNALQLALVSVLRCGQHGKSLPKCYPMMQRYVTLHM